MKTLSVKVPQKVDVELEKVASRRGETKSDMIREAIEQVLEKEQRINPSSCRDLARDLIGCIEGPSDLSSNKKHMRGYGR